MPDRLTESQVDEQLRRIFASVEEMMDRFQVGRLTPRVEPGSSLAGDDRKTNPHHLSHAVTQLSSVALDHLHALRTLILDAGALHNSAPFTLARSATEAGATALWMLTPRTRTERVRRRLQLAAQNAKDGNRMSTDSGIPPPRALEDRLQQIRLLSERAGGGDRLPPLKISEVIRWADGQHFSSMRVLLAWQVGSGFAHGRLWSSISVLDREARQSTDPEVALLRLTNSKDRVLWVMWAAFDLLAATIKLFEQRSVAPPMTD